MPPPTPPLPLAPGRPLVLPEAERRRRLLDAAAAIFMQKGYAAATMGAVAAHAGMSKKTLYQLYESKIALFDALLDNRIFQLEFPPFTSQNQEESLTQLILAMAGVLLQPDRIGLLRLMVADGQAHPELMTAFERLKLQPNLNALQQWVTAQQKIGALQAGDPAELADLLFGMTIAEPILRELMKAPCYEGAVTPEQRITRAVRIFLRGLAATH